MDNRLIFRYHVPTALPKGGRGRLRKPRRWSSWGNRVGRPVGKSAGHKPETGVRALNRAKFLKPCLREKPLGRRGVPVPKPTQVDRERIPRRSEEPSLRNSAKW